MKTLVIPVILLTVAFAGCSQSVPKCGDSEVVDLVKQIAESELGNHVTDEFVSAQGVSLNIDAIRTTSTNEQTGAHECAAQLVITVGKTGQTSEIPITYTVEMADNGDEFYVNVFGLR